MRSYLRTVGALAAMLALVLLRAPDADAAVLGKQRVLTVLATFGPRPFSRDTMSRAMRDADAFLRRSSFGRMSVDSTVTPWLDAGGLAPSCAVSRTAIPELLVAPVRAATARAGYLVGSYDRVLYMVAGSDCQFRGSAGANQAVLVGEPDSRVIVHELGHTWGLAHAGATAYCDVWCVTDEGGDLFSPMGNGWSDFSTYEKELLGWIQPQPRIFRPGKYTLYPASGDAARRQALVIDTADGEYWLEQRPDRKSPGLVVRVVHLETASPPFAPPTSLLLSPVRTGHSVIVPGETFRVRSAFAVRVVRGTSPARINVSLAAPSH